SELFIELASRCGQLFPDGVLLGDQLVFMRSVRQWNDAIDLGGTLVELARPQRGEAVADRSLRIELDGAFGQNVLQGRDRLLIKIRSDRLDCLRWAGLDERAVNRPVLVIAKT